MSPEGLVRQGNVNKTITLLRIMFPLQAILLQLKVFSATRNVSAHRQKNVDREKVGKTPTWRSLPLDRYDCAGTSLDRPKGISVGNPAGLPWPDRYPDYIWVILVDLTAACNAEQAAAGSKL